MMRKQWLSLLVCLFEICSLSSGIEEPKSGSRAKPTAAQENIEFIKGDLPALREGDWTMVVVPDTQVYTTMRPGREENIKILDLMFDWMADNKEVRNIKAVVHVGDMTSKNEPEEWKKIRNSYSKIDGVLPYVVCLGNHDEKPARREAHLNEFFSMNENPLNKGFYVDAFGKDELQNAYYTMEQNGQKLLILALEYGPRNAVVEWADEVIKAHPHHHVIVSVHEYLSESSRLRNDGLAIPEEHDVAKARAAASRKGVTDVNFGVDLKRKLFDPNPNVEFIVNGHYGPNRINEHGEVVHAGYPEVASAHRSDQRKNGLTTHAMLFNSQWIRNGGDGWLLLLEFQPNNKTVHVRTYSPYLKGYRKGSEYDYILERSAPLK
jgi:predicted MPP superfamily phosphohydrolase